MTFTAAALLGSVSLGQTDETFSRWTEVAGVANIQYRWKNLSGDCQVELRDTESKDRKYYEGKINHVTGKDDRETPIIVAQFRYAGEINHHLVLRCDKVTDVILNEKF